MRAINQSAVCHIIDGVYNIDELKDAEHFFYEFYFTPNRSGYQSLTNSGYIGKLSNTRLDSLLSAYYIELDNLHEREVSFNTFIENVEFQFRIKLPPIRYRELLIKDPLSKSEKSEILKYFKTNEFQAGVLRAASQPNALYYHLIEIGKRTYRRNREINSGNLKCSASSETF